MMKVKGSLAGYTVRYIELSLEAFDVDASSEFLASDFSLE
jgi:hypothetical protein